MVKGHLTGCDFMRTAVLPIFFVYQVNTNSYLFVLFFLHTIVERERQVCSLEPPGLLNTFSNMFIVVVHLSTHTLSCCCLSLRPWVATASFKDSVTVAQENSNQTADALVEDLQQPLFKLGNSFPGARSLRTKQQNLVWVICSACVVFTQF